VGEQGGRGCAAGGLPLSYGPDDGFSRSFPHPCLQVDGFAFALLARRTVDGLPISSNLFRLFSRSGGAAWRAPRGLAGSETSCALPPVGRAGRRSSASATLDGPSRSQRRRPKAVFTFHAAGPRLRL
jgi:hypothetical protein